MGTEGSRQLPWPALMLVVTAVAGGIFGFQSKLTSSRPPSPKGFDSPAMGLEQIEARLWEDPFRLAFRYLRRYVEGGRADGGGVSRQRLWKRADLNRMIRNDLDRGIEVVVLPAIVSGAPYAEDQERRRRSRYALLSGLHVAGYTPVESERLGIMKFDDELPGAGDGGGLFGGGGGGGDKAPYPVPFERFENRMGGEGQRHVYVFWFADQMLGNEPVAKLLKLFGKFGEETLAQKVRGIAGRGGREGRQEVSLKIIGPARSETLGRMLAEARRKVEGGAPAEVDDRHDGHAHEGHGDSTPLMLSPWATAPDRVLAREAGYLEDGEGEPGGGLGDVFERVFESAFGIDFHRTVHPDDVLMRELIEELDRRDINLHRQRDHVVLVSEWDTPYGRALPASFVAAAPESAASCITRFTYQRGLDGFLAGGTAAEVDKSGSQRAGGDAIDWFDRSHQEKASGRSQFDYMQRVASQIDALDARLRREGRGRVRAVGILGSDVYDKLVVLRALQQRLPGVVFFTTDLDAVMFQREEVKWARNLVVLSSYGLCLHDKYQKDIPPFRNAYQTAIFASVLTALGEVGHGKFTPMSGPRLFEIGKTGAYDLSIGGGAGDGGLFPERDDGWDGSRIRYLFVWASLSAIPLVLLMRHIGKRYLDAPAVADGAKKLTGPYAIYLDAWRRLWGKLPGCGGAAVAGVEYRTKNLSYIAGASGALVLVALVLVCLLVSNLIAGYQGGSGEPWSLFEGVSVWPSQLVRIAVFFLAVYFVLLSSVDLEVNLLRLGKAYHLTTDRGDISDRMRRMARRSQDKRALCAAGILVATIALLVWGPALEKSEPSAAEETARAVLEVAHLLVAAAAFVFAFGGMVGPSQFERLRESEILDAGGDGGSEVSAEQVWRRHDSGNSYRWGLRDVLCSAVAFFCFGLLLIEQFGSPSRPIRGWVSSLADWMFLSVSLLGMLFLVFYVIWVSRRCVGLIDNLSRRPTRWPAALYDAPPDGGAAPEPLRLDSRFDPRSDWFDIQFIAARTKVVGSVILYPFMIAFLQILSRHHAIDDWSWSFGAIALFAVTLMIAVYFALSLRTAAERARKKALRNLAEKHDHALFLAASERPPERIGEIASLIGSVQDRIAGMQQGAFAPISRHPVLMAVLFPFGGLGSLAFIDYLARAAS